MKRKMQAVSKHWIEHLNYRQSFDVLVDFGPSFRYTLLYPPHSSGISPCADLAVARTLWVFLIKQIKLMMCLYNVSPNSLRIQMVSCYQYTC